MELNEANPKNVELEFVPTLHVLGAEDDASLRALGEIIFRRLGVDFQSVPDAQRGLSLLAENPGWFNAVISDRDMPGKDGESFLAEVRLKYPDIQTALVTGRDYTAEEIENLRKRGVDTYIKKPYTLSQIETLTKTMEEVLRERNKKNDV